MTEDDAIRYRRHLLLPGFGQVGQERLRAARVLVVGLGGLGSPVALYLAAAGVGRLLLADCDAVDLSNLQRQLLHTSDRVGMSKVDSAGLSLRAINPGVELVPIKRALTADTLPDLVREVDLVVDGSDNFATRFAVNAACWRAGVPLVWGAVSGLEGQVMTVDARQGGPCYHCLYAPTGGAEDGCAVTGVLAPVVGIIGSLQATEAIKLLAGLGEPLRGRLLLLDAWRMQWREVRVPADPQCPVCQGGPR